VCGEPVTITFAAGAASWDPPAAVVFTGCAPGGGAAETASCGYLNFFATPVSARYWASQHPHVTGTVLDQATAQARGAQTFGRLLDNRHHRRRAGLTRPPARGRRPGGLTRGNLGPSAGLRPGWDGPGNGHHLISRPRNGRALAREIRASGVAVTIVVHEHKRLGRGIELAALAEQLRAADIGLEFLTGDLQGSHDPSGVVFTVLAALSGMEREYIRRSHPRGPRVGPRPGQVDRRRGRHRRCDARLGASPPGPGDEPA